MNIASFAEFESYNRGRLSRSGKYLRGKCHIHGGDNQQSGQFNTETGHYKCHQCGFFGYDREYTNGGNRNTFKPYMHSARDQREQPKIKPVRTDLAGLMARYQATLPGSPGEEYLGRRGISLELAQRYGAGYGKDKHGIERVIFPHTSPSGEILNIYGRAVSDGIKLKHKHMAGNKGIFNAQALHNGMVFICEAPFDALSLIAAGHENVCAIFGNTGLSNKWEWVKSKVLIFCFDNDKGGEKWRQLAAEATLNGKRVYYLEKECYQGFKDLNEVWTKTGKIDVGDLPEPPDEQEIIEEPSSEVAPSSHHEGVSISPELSADPDPLPGDGADRDPGSAGGRAQIPGPNSTEGEQPDLVAALPPGQRARRAAIETIVRHYRAGVYPWAKEQHPDCILQQDRLWEEMDRAAESGDEVAAQAAGSALVSLWDVLHRQYAEVFGPAEERQEENSSALPAELAERPGEPRQEPDVPAEVEVPLGKWSRDILKREAVKVKTVPLRGIVCELI